MKRYELAPNGTQKSFYGKAVVEIDNAGNETLYSYDTPIIKRVPSVGKASCNIIFIAVVLPAPFLPSKP